MKFRSFSVFLVLDFIAWFNRLGRSKNYFIYLFFVYLDPPWSLLLYQMWRLWVMKFQNLAFYERNWLHQNQNNAYNSACDLLLLQIIRHLQRNNCHFWPIFRRSRRLNQTRVKKFVIQKYYIFLWRIEFRVPEVSTNIL